MAQEYRPGEIVPIRDLHHHARSGARRHAARGDRDQGPALSDLEPSGPCPPRFLVGRGVNSTAHSGRLPGFGRREWKAAFVPLSGWARAALGLRVDTIALKARNDIWKLRAARRRTHRRYASPGQLKKRAGRKWASSALCRPPTISSATSAPRNGDIVTPLWVMAI
jgi:hypothetical protein